MKKHQDVFEGRIEVPEIVRAKADEVFQVIREEKIEMIEGRTADAVRPRIFVPPIGAARHFPRRGKL